MEDTTLEAPLQPTVAADDDRASRVRAYYLSRGAMLALFNWRHYDFISLPEFPGLPEGARVVEVSYECAYRGFAVIVQHDSFEPLEPGHEMPKVWPTLETKSVSLNVHELLANR